jgi:hypothetical protein
MSAFQFFPSMNQDVSNRLPAAVRSAHREENDRTSELDMSRYYDIYSSGSPLEATPSKTTWEEYSCAVGKVSEYYHHPFSRDIVEDEYQHPSDNKNIVSWGDHDITQPSCKNEKIGPSV